MQVHGDGIDCGGPPTTTGSSMNVQLFSQASRDFRWKPSQGITFHKSTRTRSYSTGNIPQRKVPSHGVAPPKKSSVLNTASAASKNTRSTVPVLPYVPRKPTKTQIAELMPKQVNRTPYRGFIDLGNDFDALGQALAEAGVGQDGAKDQTRNTWEPVNFITEKSQAGIHDLSVECIIAKKEQIAAQLEKDLQMVRDVAPREEQARELAARQEENARQVIAQRERDLPKARIVAQRKEQARKLRARQKAKARQVAAQRTIKPREARLAIKPREARRRIKPGAAYQGGWAKLVRMETLRREKLVKPKQEAAAAEAL
ncbi:MAG: hypothetical protein M1830_009252, partial [Pleopsidium flavum]